MTSPPYWGLRDYDHEDQIGLEPTPEYYVENLIEVFQEVRRVLKPTGTFFLNISDTYGGSSGQHGTVSDDFPRNREAYDGKLVARNAGIPDKCMSMVPERVVMALIEDGWILRNKIVWTKPNPMPESVKDRFSTTWEYVYMFSKRQRYYFDLDAVREPYKNSTAKRVQQNDGNPNWNGDAQRGHPDGDEDTLDPDQFMHPVGKNPGDTWEIPTAQLSEAHFAVFPEEPCEKPVKAGCPPKVCARCGRPYERTVSSPENGDNSEKREYSAEIPGNRSAPPQQDRQVERTMDGWDQQCDCATDETAKGVVLDPFAGAGTTCLVARRFNRHYVGIELNEEYAEMARQRIQDEIGETPIDEFVKTCSERSER